MAGTSRARADVPTDTGARSGLERRLDALRHPQVAEYFIAFDKRRKSYKPKELARH